MEIKYLPNDTKIIEPIAAWLHHEWGRLIKGSTLSKSVDSLSKNFNPDQMPLTMVAMLNDSPVGVARLVPKDVFQLRADLSPWLVAVYVDPPYRGIGVGAHLCRQLEVEAIRLKFNSMYLWTPDAQKFYERLGWQIQEDKNYLNQKVSLMKKELNHAT